MYESERSPLDTVPPPSRRKKRKSRKPYLSMIILYLALAGALMLVCYFFLFRQSPMSQASAAAPSNLSPSAGDVQQSEDDPPRQVDPAAWYMILVNPWTPLPEGYQVTLTQLEDGHAVDERCYSSLQSMMDDCRAAGLSPMICSSYRSQAKQERLYRNQVNKYVSRGYAAEAAKLEAGIAVAVPGTSEHQLGLAVDIVDLHNQNLNKSQEDTAVQKWMMENSWRYGFILRYPNEKSAITGIIYEPWHYRYVGKDAAKEIYEQGVCLEEYLEQLNGNATP